MGGGTGGRGDLGRICKPHKFLLSLQNCRDYNVAPLLQNKSRLVGLFVLRFLGVHEGGCVFLPPPRTAHPAPCYFFFPLLFLGMEKQLWGPLGGAGVEVEVSARAQLSKSSGAWGAETTGQGNAEERARTLFRLLRTSASLFFSGSRRSRSLLTSSYSRAAAAAAPSSFPLPLLLRARRAAPHPDQPGSLLAVGEKVREPGAGDPTGQKIGTRTCWAKRPKVARGWGGKSFLVAACFVPTRTPACGEGFLPWSGPRASGWRRRGRGTRLLPLRCPRGKASHVCG